MGLKSDSSNPSDDEKHVATKHVPDATEDQFDHPELAAMSVEERAKFEKKLLRKLDFKLIPWVSTGCNPFGATRPPRLTSTNG